MMIMIIIKLIIYMDKYICIAENYKITWVGWKVDGDGTSLAWIWRVSGREKNDLDKIGNRKKLKVIKNLKSCKER